MIDESKLDARPFVGFVIGIGSSLAVGLPLYFLSKRDARLSEKRLLLVLQRQQIESRHAFSTIREVSIKAEDLLRRYIDIREHLPNADRTRGPAEVGSLADSYSDVARSLARIAGEELGRTASLPDELSVDWLLELHRQFFPKGFELAGKLRVIRVWIGAPGDVPGTARLVPPPPEEVPKRLSKLLSQWNQGWAELRKAGRREQALVLARFHHDFVVVHPFSDGNGVTARTLTMLQARRLGARNARDILVDAEYYAALQEADAGSIDRLERVVEGTIA